MDRIQNHLGAAKPHHADAPRPLDYRQAVALLYRRGNEVQRIRLGLHRIEAILDSFGSPHLKFPALHITGTNGKGSVAAMSEAILRHAGWKTGLMTPPRPERIKERSCVNRPPAPPRQFAAPDPSG